MTGKDLFAGLSFIDERYIDEAEHGRLLRFPLLRIVSVAACLCLVMLSLWYIRPQAGPGPETTLPNYVEGFPSVVVYAREMTDSGFSGTVAELVNTDLFGIDMEAGMELEVVFTEQTAYLTSEGELISAVDGVPDLSGCRVMVEFTGYDPGTASIVADLIWEFTPE